MPVGFCCSKCDLYNEVMTCLNTKTKYSASEELEEPLEEIHPISTSIEGGILKVVLEQGDREIPIFIDLQKKLDLK